MPRISLTASELDSMRSRMCDAALDIFRSHGTEAVTLRALADVLGISHTLPYRYFENKDALLAGVRLACFGLFDSYVRQRERTEAGPLERVFSVVDAYVGFVFEHSVEYTLIFATPQPPPLRYPDLLAARKRLFDHAVNLVELCIDAGHVHGDARELTHCVWASLHGLLSLHVANQLVHGEELGALVRPTICRILGLPVAEAARNEPRAERRPVVSARHLRPVTIRGKSR